MTAEIDSATRNRLILRYMQNQGRIVYNRTSFVGWYVPAEGREVRVPEKIINVEQEWCECCGITTDCARFRVDSQTSTDLCLNCLLGGIAILDVKIKDKDPEPNSRAMRIE